MRRYKHPEHTIENLNSLDLSKEVNLSSAAQKKICIYYESSGTTEMQSRESEELEGLSFERTGEFQYILWCS